TQRSRQSSLSEAFPGGWKEAAMRLTRIVVFSFLCSILSIGVVRYGFSTSGDSDCDGVLDDGDGNGQAHSGTLCDPTGEPSGNYELRRQLYDRLEPWPTRHRS